MGIRPDFLVCRAPFDTGRQIKEKLSLFCSIPTNHIVDAVDAKSIYEVPLNIHDQDIDKLVLEHFNLPIKRSNLSSWKEFIKNMNNLHDEIEISIVGKYVSLHDAYLSVMESLRHAGYKFNTKVNINWVNSEDLESMSEKEIRKLFKKTIEFARNVCHIEDASSSEFGKTSNPIIDIMEDKKDLKDIGGTLRLGNYDCHIKKGSEAYKAYGEEFIKERHRHRYEFNNDYREILEENGLVISGMNDERNLVEIIEYPHNDCFIACQFHPEFKSRPTRPHPLFAYFISKSIKK